ncbi:putative protein MSS51 homolog, mitochondrial [Temnothorax longispinosus]|uniref:putative protein MSS51 homolog, mitochondrial n=1 Tax=Temnothorax longispinosus TaxID=300112 RepID=UPI003A99A454
MESEARNQINNDYNKFFYATMCHVCKRFDVGVQLKLCSNCKMISYCGKEHQKQHWKQHKPLCKAIQDVLQNYSMDYCGGTTDEAWAAKKLTFARLVSSRLERPLHVDEKQMIYFPKECLVCHESKSLQSCKKCAASFCQIHKSNPDHWKPCVDLGLCLRSNLLSIKYSSPDLHSYLQRVSYTSHTFRDMQGFIKAFGSDYVPTNSEISYQLLAAKHSEYLTRPLTLFYVMRSLNYVKEQENLVIHVVGASCAEKATLSGWEVFPRLLEAVMSVKIVMIGPELKHHDVPLLSTTCAKKSLTIEFHDVLYEDYVRSSSFVKPDLVAGFNLNIYKHELGSERETWAPSIRMLAEQNCPFVSTSVTRQDSKKKIERINTILGRQVDYIYKEKNLYASFTPHRVPGPERVCYHNQYVVVYQSFCP